jgi:hypothetical protein
MSGKRGPCDAGGDESVDASKRLRHSVGPAENSVEARASAVTLVESLRQQLREAETALNALNLDARDAADDGSAHDAARDGDSAARDADADAADDADADATDDADAADDDADGAARGADDAARDDDSLANVNNLEALLVSFARFLSGPRDSNATAAIALTWANSNGELTLLEKTLRSTGESDPDIVEFCAIVGALLHPYVAATPASARVADVAALTRHAAANRSPLYRLLHALVLLRVQRKERRVAEKRERDAQRPEEETARRDHTLGATGDRQHGGAC